MTRKPKKVEFHFDERSVVTTEEINPGEYGLVGFDDEQMKIIQSYRMNERNNRFTIERLSKELTEKYGEVSQLTSENDRLKARLSDYEETYRRVMSEQCAPDEQHCTCVPALKIKIRKMQTVISCLLDFLLEDGVPEECWTPEYKATVHTARDLLKDGKP